MKINYLFINFIFLMHRRRWKYSSYKDQIMRSIEINDNKVQVQSIYNTYQSNMLEFILFLVKFLTS